jgi:hypothetical protein
MALHPETGEVIFIQRGFAGYTATSGRLTAEDVTEFNAYHKVTQDQQSAMLTGSMFGFDCEGADPDHSRPHPETLQEARGL